MTFHLTKNKMYHSYLFCCLWFQKLSKEPAGHRGGGLRAGAEGRGCECPSHAVTGTAQFHHLYSVEAGLCLGCRKQGIRSGWAGSLGPSANGSEGTLALLLNNVKKLHKEGSCAYRGARF